MDAFDEFSEGDLNKYFKRLNEFSYVKNFDLIQEGLLNLRNNQQFIKMGIIPKTGFNKEGSKWKFEEDKIPFIKAAKNGLSNFPVFYLPPLTKVIKYKFFIALYSMIQLNYIYCANEKLDDEDYKSIILGDIAAYFTYFVEDFENPKTLPEPSEEFFKQITDIKYENKDVNKFFNCIWDVTSAYTTGYKTDINYFYYKNKKAGYPKKILWADYYSTEK